LIFFIEYRHETNSCRVSVSSSMGNFVKFVIAKKKIVKVNWKYKVNFLCTWYYGIIFN